VNILLLIIVLSACSVAVVLYRIFLRQRSQLNQYKQQLKELEIVLGKTQTDLARSLKEAQGQGEFQELAGQIVSKLDHGVICIDKKGIVRLVNTYAEKFLDISPAVGKPYSEVLHKLKIDGRNDFLQFKEAMMGKRLTLPDTVEFTTKKGDIPISATLTPLFSDGKNAIIAFIFADNSRNVARIMEEKAFFSAAAHELRTPLSVIRLAVYLLLTEFDKLGQEEIIDHLKKIEKTSERLTSLVNDFLNVSRIDLGRLEVDKTPFDIVSLTDEVIQELSDLAKKRKLYVHHKVTGEHRMVMGDKKKSKEVLTNLVSNGIKYTLQGGLTITHKKDKGILMTKVTDTGSGITSASQRLLFRRFMQVGRGRLQSSEKSTGLGLYISKKFAQLMGGDVVLETSKPNKGSTFAFILPVG
jgi:signal transduction histidine kinase